MAIRAAAASANWSDIYSFSWCQLERHIQLQVPKASEGKETEIEKGEKQGSTYLRWSS
jgi:hypothetical protein